ncbi:hypothetical protein Pelo_16956 [Pelomyxa schiedti]|nr:hypothetical protein Pelo_16956 [Pelomyxa schiedti]
MADGAAGLVVTTIAGVRSSNCRVFEFGAESLKPRGINLIAAMSRVCRSWNAACNASRVWETLYRIDFGHFPLQTVDTSGGATNWKDRYKTRFLQTIVIHLTTKIPQDSPTLSPDFFKCWMYSFNKCPLHLEVFCGLPPHLDMRPPALVSIPSRKGPVGCISFISQFLLISGCPYTEEDFTQMGRALADQIFDEDTDDRDVKSVQNVIAHISGNTLLTLNVVVLAKDPILALMSHKRRKFDQFLDYALFESHGVLLHPMFKSLRKFNRHLRKTISGKGKPEAVVWNGVISQRSLLNQMKCSQLQYFGCHSDWGGESILECPEASRLAKCTRGLVRWMLLTSTGSSINWVFDPPHHVLNMAIWHNQEDEEEDSLSSKYGLTEDVMNRIEEDFRRAQEERGHSDEDYDSSVEPFKQSLEQDIVKHSDTGLTTVTDGTDS